MAIPILLKRSQESGKKPLPEDLLFGELALNFSDGKLYYKNDKGEIKSFDSFIPAPVVTERFTFDSASLRWEVTHNRNTDNFTETLTDSDGNRFFAKVRIVDKNSFYVDLTSAIKGHIDVTFVQ